MEKYTKVKKFDLSDADMLACVHMIFGISHSPAYGNADKIKQGFTDEHLLLGLRSNKAFLYPNTDFPILRQMEMQKHKVLNNAADSNGKTVISVDLSTDIVNKKQLILIKQYRDDLKRDLLKAMGVYYKRKQYELMEELYVSGNPTERKKGETIISELLKEYDVFCDQLATFILGLTHALYYEPNTLRDRPTKVLELIYQKAIALCHPIRKQFEKELIEEYAIVDIAKKVLGDQFGL